MRISNERLGYYSISVRMSGSGLCTGLRRRLPLQEARGLSQVVHRSPCTGGIDTGERWQRIKNWEHYREVEQGEERNRCNSSFLSPTEFEFAPSFCGGTGAREKKKRKGGGWEEERPAKVRARDRGRGPLCLYNDCELTH